MKLPNIFIIFLHFFFCAYSWIRTNALPYPYGRFLCLSGLTDSISNISRHYFDSSVVSCSVYASNLYRQIVLWARLDSNQEDRIMSRAVWPFTYRPDISLKELLQYKYNKKIWNFQIFFNIFYIFCRRGGNRTHMWPITLSTVYKTEGIHSYVMLLFYQRTLTIQR